MARTPVGAAMGFRVQVIAMGGNYFAQAASTVASMGRLSNVEFRIDFR